MEVCWELECRRVSCVAVVWFPSSCHHVACHILLSEKARFVLLLFGYLRASPCRDERERNDVKNLVAAEDESWREQGCHINLTLLLACEIGLGQGESSGGWRLIHGLILQLQNS